MSLDRYWSKRHFERTPEPRGERPPGAAGGPRRFVVQRHRATRLHYDFRLEIAGVLVSWAVPRGPSMRPLERRMAARTEDHPMEYFDFEGIIPAGEYGAGDVIVWDWGTWEPETLDDPAIAVQDGELKIVLDGERLKGRFVLVRTRRDEALKEDWLLIHKNDEHADPLWDIDAFPTSVKSGLTNEQVRNGMPAVWDSGAPASMAEIDLSAATQVPLPDFISPMLATPVDRPFSHADWLFELKLDGYRVEAVVHGGAVRLWTRNHKDASQYFPAFAAAPPAWIGAYDAIVDGEMVALDEEGRPSFSLLQDLAGLRGLGARRGERRVASRTPGGTPDGEAEGDAPPPGRLVYHAFDLLHLDSRDLLAVPLEERKKLLRLVLRDHPAVRYVRHVVEHGEEFHEAVRKQGLEGSIAKLRASAYESGRRSRAWLKVRARREQELVLVGYEPGKGSHRELGALLVATREGSRWRFAGEVGSGLDAPTRKLMRHLLDEHAADDSPVDDAPRLPGARWSEPRHVIRAEFNEWTTDGLLRQATYKGREMGRDPLEVTRERVEGAEDAVQRARAAADRTARRGPRVAKSKSKSVDEVRSEGGGPGGSGGRDGGERGLTLVLERPAETVPARAVSRPELADLDALGDRGRWSVGGHVVSLTNLDKVLFPGAGYTKRDLVRYYTTVSPVLLPYLVERPLNVHRWPDGVAGRTQFWQKQIPAHAPDWVARWDYPEAGHDQSHTYVVADGVATMAWLSNQAVIDLHPWNSRLPDYARPSYAYIDIDPGERTTWAEVLTLARLYRTALQHLDVRGYPKVTGKRGIQVWIPLEPRYTWDETRDWVAGLSQGVGTVVPELVSWEWGKAERGGKARLDFTQNAINKTLVAPYAVRPVPSAAVSAPITWDELDDPLLRPDRWDLRSIVERVETRGDLFRGALDDFQALPPLS